MRAVLWSGNFHGMYPTTRYLSSCFLRLYLRWQDDRTGSRNNCIQLNNSLGKMWRFWQRAKLYRPSPFTKYRFFWGGGHRLRIIRIMRINTGKSRLYVIHLCELFGHTCLLLLLLFPGGYSIWNIHLGFIDLYVFFLVPFGKRINETLLIREIWVSFKMNHSRSS